MKAALSTAGFTQVEDLTGADLHSRSYAQRTDGPALRGGLAQLARAWIRR